MRAVDTAIKKYDEHSFRKVDCACVRMQRGDGGFFGCDAIYGWGSDPPPPLPPTTRACPRAEVILEMAARASLGDAAAFEMAAQASPALVIGR